MSEKFEVGDLVQITEEPWNIFAGQSVFLTKYDENSNSYEFYIPCQKGSVPAGMIKRLLIRGIKIPDHWELR